MTADSCGLRTSGERLRWGREREGAEVSSAELNHATEFNVMRKEVTRKFPKGEEDRIFRGHSSVIVFLFLFSLLTELSL